MAAMIKRLIVTAKAPRPVAPYNQAVLADRTIYVSGILGLDPKTMQLVPGGVVEETKKALESLGHILKSADSSYEKVVKVTILLKNIEDFGAVNEVYATFFTRFYPARCAYQVAALPLKANIEIEAIALTGEVKIVDDNHKEACSTCGKL